MRSDARGVAAERRERLGGAPVQKGAHRCRRRSGYGFKEEVVGEGEAAEDLGALEVGQGAS